MTDAKRLSHLLARYLTGLVSVASMAREAGTSVDMVLTEESREAEP